LKQILNNTSYDIITTPDLLQLRKQSMKEENYSKHGGEREREREREREM